MFPRGGPPLRVRGHQLRVQCSGATTATTKTVTAAAIRVQVRAVGVGRRLGHYIDRCGRHRFWGLEGRRRRGDLGQGRHRCKALLLLLLLLLR